ncbi:MAG: hypothetical protein ACD_75C00357G0003 [uncultured bacterium]|nr:MAG: hypothetical protein ACD_75C00357G0003 [uncultured bacterium]
MSINRNPRANSESDTICTIIAPISRSTPARERENNRIPQCFPSIESGAVNSRASLPLAGSVVFCVIMVSDCRACSIKGPL